MTRVTPGRTLAVIAARGGSKGIPQQESDRPVRQAIDRLDRHAGGRRARRRCRRGVFRQRRKSSPPRRPPARSASGARRISPATSHHRSRHGFMRWSNSTAGLARLDGLSPCRQRRRSGNPATSNRRSRPSSGKSSTACSRSARSRTISTGASAPTARSRSITTSATGAMRQQIEKRYLENGSFYVLVPSLAARTEEPARRQDRYASDGAPQDVPDRSPRRHQALCGHHAQLRLCIVPTVFSLHGRIAVVTGASRGIGAAIARGLARRARRVFGLSRSGAPRLRGVEPRSNATSPTMPAVARGVRSILRSAATGSTCWSMPPGISLPASLAEASSTGSARPSRST